MDIEEKEYRNKTPWKIHPLYLFSPLKIRDHAKVSQKLCPLVTFWNLFGSSSASFSIQILNSNASISDVQVAPAKFVLCFDVSDDTMTKRLMGRAATSGRADDNAETIKKRLVTFHDLTKPVIDHYTGKGKVKMVHFLFDPLRFVSCSSFCHSLSP